MYVQIFAKSEENETSRGKTSWFNAGKKLPTITLLSTRPTHLGSPPWHLQIDGSQNREASSGMNNGEYRAYDYELTLELTPTDLAALVNFALTNGLVKVTAAKRSKNRKKPARSQ